jgi:tetratricopeptide (TPR) repeat protein
MLEKALEMGSKFVPAGYGERARELARAQEHLEAFRAGEYVPEAGAEDAIFGDLLYELGEYPASASAYANAFEADPRLVADRYNASCAAALAGNGKGVGAEELRDDARREHRDQALAWLRVQLADRERRHEAGELPTEELKRQMRHWLGDSDLAGVRGSALGSDEVAAWRAFWQAVYAHIE